MKQNKKAAVLIALLLAVTLPAEAEEQLLISDDSTETEIVTDPVPEDEEEAAVVEDPEEETVVSGEVYDTTQPLSNEFDDPVVNEDSLLEEETESVPIFTMEELSAENEEDLLSSGNLTENLTDLLSAGDVPAVGGQSDPNYFLSAGRLPEYHRWTKVADTPYPDGIHQEANGGYRCCRGRKYFIDGYCTVNGKIYYADENGYLLTGWQKTLFSNDSGLDSLNDEEFRLRYYDPQTCELVTGFREIDGILHYFKEDQGKLGTNLYLERDGQMYYADRYGICGPVKLRYGNVLLTEENQNNVEYLARNQVPAVDPQTFRGQGGEYTFRPKWYDGLTSSEVFGCQVKTVSDGVYCALPDESMKGRIGCIFRNVGRYNGHEIDLKLTIQDYTFFSLNGSNEVGYFYVLDGRIGITATNLQDITASMQFLDHSTGDLISVKGYATFSDIDIGQSVDILSSVDEVYVDQNCVLYKDPSSLSFSAPWVTSRVGSAVTDEDEENWVQVNYSSDTLVFRFGSAYSHYCFADTGRAINGESHYCWRQGYSGNEYDYGILVDEKLRQSWLGFYFNRLGMVSIPPVSKLVSDSDETEVTENTLSDKTEGFLYTLCHNVPGESPSFYYSSYFVTDQIPDELIPDPSGFLILDDGGRDVTERFLCETDGNLVIFRAREEWLTKDLFYDNNYYYQIPVAVREGAELHKDEDGYYRFINSCKASFTRSQGEESTDSNKTVTRVKLALPECEIVITKVISENEILRAHGNPTFFFSADGTDTDGNPHHYEEFLCFGESGYESDEAGNAFKSCRISHIPAGTYKVYELSCLDYYLTGASADTANMSIRTGAQSGPGSDPADVAFGICELSEKAPDAGITFRDAKQDYHGYRHNDAIKNTIPLSLGDA